jgi:endonuclease/exonuclease/phosphatase family metal-dependent hydrolase
MTFNLWVGGESGGQPLSQTAAVIRAARADVAGLQETWRKESRGVRPDHARELAALLGWQCVEQGGGRAIITRFRASGPTPGRWGAVLELPSGRRVRVFNAHFHHAPYQPYQLLGIPYEGGAFIRTEADAVRFAREARGREVEGLVGEVKAALETGDAVLVTGDFNEPSHLDWTEAAAKAGKCPLAVAWPATRAMAALGLADCFREARPDAVNDRGDTWTPTTRPDDPKDRHDRIDFVLAGGRGMIVRACEVVGEDKRWADIVVAPYPSDHRAVVAEVELKP